VLQALSPLPREPKTFSPPKGFRGVERLDTVGRAASGRGLFRDGDSGSLMTDAQLAGLRYEKKVKDALVVHFPKVEVGPWIEFRDAFGLRRCQPDAILLDPLVVVEVKNHHDVRAWWQLRQLYAPVVEKLFGRCPAVCEIVSSFDPAVPWPEATKPFFVFDEFYRWLQEPTGFAVFQWRL
jgi:hypothetical protein